MTLQASGQEALEALRWRDEILQALFWMRGEGLAAEVAPVGLAGFLGADPADIDRHFELLVADGYLEPGPGGTYRLTAQGAAEGGRSFQDEFADFVRVGHYECGPGCWCKDPKHAGEPCPGQPPPRKDDDDEPT